MVGSILIFIRPCYLSAAFKFTSLFLLSLLLLSCLDTNKEDSSDLINKRIDERIERLENYIDTIDLSLDSIEAYHREGELKHKIKDFDSIEAYGNILAMMIYEVVTEVREIPKEELLAMEADGDVSGISSIFETKEENAIILINKLKERKELMRLEIESLVKIRQIGLAEYIAEDMVPIPAGSFSMGSIDHETEMPVHEVDIKEFYMAKYELTEMLWYLVMGNPSKATRKDYHDFTIYYCSDCPIEVISWQHAQSFLNNLNEFTGSNYRLPTEAEWEYACRSGGEDEMYCGGDNLDDLAWFNETESLTKRFVGYPVGSKNSNQLGLYDMSGNVAEWVEDCWHENYEGASSDGSAKHKKDCKERVLRGGTYMFPDFASRSTFREEGVSPDSPLFGFRLAKDKEWWDLF